MNTPVAIYSCATCHEEILPIVRNDDGSYPITNGYGYDHEGNKHCYSCCAAQDKAAMIANGKYVLYLCEQKNKAYRVTNWPNSLSFHVMNVSKSWHNMARVRYDVWFVGPDCHIWHGYQVGDNTQICHVKRTKEIWRGSTPAKKYHLIAHYAYASGGDCTVHSDITNTLEGIYDNMGIWVGMRQLEGWKQISHLEPHALIHPNGDLVRLSIVKGE